MALLSPARAAAGAALVALLAGGCDFIHPPSFVPPDPDQLVVHAVLRGGTDTATVLVTRVGTHVDPVAVSDARVRVAGPDGAVTLAEVRSLPVPCGWAVVVPPLTEPATVAGCYAAVMPGGIRPGQAYTLEVDVPTGERVRGRTVVPAAPVIHAPGDRLRVMADTTPYGSLRAADFVTLRWTVEAGPVGLSSWPGRVWARGQEGARCSGTQLLRPDLFPPVVRESAGDSVRVLVEAGGCHPGNMEARLHPDSLEVMVGVTAYDSVYLEYARYREEFGVGRDEVSKGLEGAYGLFGSVAISRRRLVLVRR